MHLVYLDESGDPGIGPKSPTSWLCLGVVIVKDSDWMAVLDRLVEARRRLKRKYGIPTRAELKGNHFTQGTGAFDGLGIPPRKRAWLFRRLAMFQATLPIRVFAIAIDKDRCHAAGSEPRNRAWTFAIQKINRFCQDEASLAMIFPDEGQGDFIRRRVREMRRRHFIRGAFGGQLEFRTELIVEDPNDRVSEGSYFIQLADWNAYAAHRSSGVDPRKGVDPTTWDALGPVLHDEINAVRRLRFPDLPQAISIWPDPI